MIPMMRTTEGSAVSVIRRDVGRRFFPESILDVLLDEVRKGHRLTDICADNRNLPHASSFYRWMADDQALRERYQTALLEGEAAKKTATA